jgi:hypothetical protein
MLFSKVANYEWSLANIFACYAAGHHARGKEETNLKITRSEQNLGEGWTVSTAWDEYEIPLPKLGRQGLLISLPAKEVPILKKGKLFSLTSEDGTKADN